MTNHIVLFEPLMPANTGNIARTTAGTDAVLHLIEPLGFELDDKHVKRAGLDYWDHVKLVKHPSLPDFLDTLAETDNLYLVSKFANQDYTRLITHKMILTITSYLEKKPQGYQKYLCVKIRRRLFVSHRMIHMFVR